MTNINDLTQWAEFGILALIIGALLSTIFVGFKTFLTFIGTIHQNFKEIVSENKKQHSEDLKMITTQHREERQRWIEEAKLREEKYVSSIHEFSQAIRDLRDKV